MPEMYLAPAAWLVQSLNKSDREHEELGREDFSAAVFAATVEANHNNKLTCKVVDEEAGSAGSPTTFHLNPS